MCAHAGPNGGECLRLWPLKLFLSLFSSNLDLYVVESWLDLIDEIRGNYGFGSVFNFQRARRHLGPLPSGRGL